MLTVRWALLGLWLSIHPFMFVGDPGGLESTDLAGPVRSVSIIGVPDAARGEPTEETRFYTREGRLQQWSVKAVGIPELSYEYSYDADGRLLERTARSTDGGLFDRRTSDYSGGKLLLNRHFDRWDVLRWEDRFAYVEEHGVWVTTAAYSWGDFIGEKVLHEYVSRSAHVGDDGRLVKVVEYSDSGQVRTEWSAEGRQMVLKVFAGGSVTERVVWLLDENRVVRELRYGGAGDLQANYGYAYEWDERGNWVSITRVPSTADRGPGAPETSVVYSRSIEYYE